MQGVPTQQSAFMTPAVVPERRRVTLHQKPTVTERSIRSIDPRTLDESALTKLQALDPFPAMPEAPHLPPRGPNTLVGQAGKRAAEWNEGTRYSAEAHSSGVWENS